jgi:hypothetical protein
MKRFVSILALAGFVASTLVIATSANAKERRHHYKDGSYSMVCVNEEATCANWNIGLKPN